MKDLFFASTETEFRRCQQFANAFVTNWKFMSQFDSCMDVKTGERSSEPCMAVLHVGEFILWSERVWECFPNMPPARKHAVRNMLPTVSLGVHGRVLSWPV